MSSRAGFSSCASTFERVHTRCAEINEFQAETTEFDLIIVVTVTAVVIYIIIFSHISQPEKREIWQPEVMKQKVRAVSSNFGCHKAGGRKDQAVDKLCIPMSTESTLSF